MTIDYERAKRVHPKMKAMLTRASRLPLPSNVLLRSNWRAQGLFKNGTSGVAGRMTGHAWQRALDDAGIFIRLENL